MISQKISKRENNRTQQTSQATSSTTTLPSATTSHSALLPSARASDCPATVQSVGEKRKRTKSTSVSQKHIHSSSEACRGSEVCIANDNSADGSRVGTNSRPTTPLGEAYGRMDPCIFAPAEGESEDVFQCFSDVSSQSGHFTFTGGCSSLPSGFASDSAPSNGGHTFAGSVTSAGGFTSEGVYTTSEKSLRARMKRTNEQPQPQCSNTSPRTRRQSRMNPSVSEANGREAAVSPSTTPKLVAAEQLSKAAEQPDHGSNKSRHKRARISTDSSTIAKQPSRNSEHSIKPKTMEQQPTLTQQPKAVEQQKVVEQLMTAQQLDPQHMAKIFREQLDKLKSEVKTTQLQQLRVLDTDELESTLLRVVRTFVAEINNIIKEKSKSIEERRTLLKEKYFNDLEEIGGDVVRCPVCFQREERERMKKLGNCKHYHCFECSEKMQWVTDQFTVK
jgi:hypothetical protein